MVWKTWSERVSKLFNRRDADPNGRYIPTDYRLTLLLYTPSADNLHCTYALHRWGARSKDTVIKARTLSMMEKDLVRIAWPTRSRV